MEADRDIKIASLDKSTWKDFEALFESKGGPSYCWCMAWRMTHEELKQNNSPSRKQYIRERVTAETPTGLLAYVDDEAVGWCSIAPRETYRRLDGDESLEAVWSLVCFYIKKKFRGQGLIYKLIESAKAYAKENGARYLEAYPVAPDSPSYRFMGFVDTFHKSGFSFVKMAGSRRHVMTCKL
ncbi:MAG TPA: GNAT family N-acetyltransferase [Cytophagales bacterium]|nr:GNAT family N-acetyltransferase [Cytophagales bacterium]